MTDKQARTHRGINTWAAVGLALLVVAAILITVGLVRGQSPPQPDAASSSDAATAENSGNPTAPDTPASSTADSESAAEDEPTTPDDPTTDSAPETAMAASAPAHLTIPAIDVDTSIMKLGLTDDDELEVPSLGKNAPAGWYDRSPTPGEVGPSLIVGHVDSAKDGPAVFFKLGALHRKDTLTVTRDDGSKATFSVDDVTDYGKDSFPEYKVYGNTKRPEIRLITCGGDFNEQTGHYEDNIVVTGHLVDEG